MKFDLIEITKQIDKGNIIVHNHRTLPLSIYNYSRTVQYDKSWDDLTLRCRPLVLDNDGNLVGDSLPKFFNLEEHIVDGILNLDINLPHIIYEKLDGSYIQLFCYQGTWIINSKGSFYSDHVNYAWEIFNEKYKLNLLNKDYTYIFELIHPDTRIVVDYGNEKDLKLLAVRHNNIDLDIENFKENFNLCQTYNKMSLSALKGA